MIAVDSNIIAYLLIPNDKYNDLADRLFQKDSRWVAPILWQFEFMNILTSYYRHGILNAEDCKTIYDDAQKTVVTRGMGDFKDVFKLVECSQLTSYDCEFVAFATNLGLPLITEDKKILNEFPNIALSIDQYLD